MGGPKVVKRARTPEVFSESLVPPVLVLCPARTAPTVVRTQVTAAVHFTCFTTLEASVVKRYGPSKAIPKYAAHRMPNSSAQARTRPSHSRSQSRKSRPIRPAPRTTDMKETARIIAGPKVS